MELCGYTERMVESAERSKKGTAKSTMAGWAWNCGATNIRVRRMTWRRNAAQPRF